MNELKWEQGHNAKQSTMGRMECYMICSSCFQDIPVTGFYLHSNGKPRKQCKQCRNKSNVEWIKANSEKECRLRKIRYDKNPEKPLEATRQWRLRNKSYDAFRAKLYRMRKLGQLAKWADLDKIKEIYLTCPPGYHVDHIIPLKGKLVSGLHVETNLQHLPALENIIKRNKYE